MLAAPDDTDTAGIKAAPAVTGRLGTRAGAAWLGGITAPVVVVVGCSMPGGGGGGTLLPPPEDPGEGKQVLLLLLASWSHVTTGNPESLGITDLDYMWNLKIIK